MRILITGVCGFVGTSLIKGFVETGSQHTFFGVDNFIRPGSEANRRSLAALGVKLWHADIRNPSDLECLPKVDAVIDAAAHPSVLAGVDGKVSSRQLVEHNLIGTLNLVEFCKQNQAALILLSTSRVYSIPPLANLPVVPVNNRFSLNPNLPLPIGVSSQGVNETFSTSAPVSLYGSTKVASESLALEYGTTFDFPVYINRCGVLAGPGQFGRADQGIFAFWLNSYLRRKPMKYIGFGGMGLQVRDCLHPRDLVPLLEKQLGGHRTSAPIINCAGGIDSALSLRELSDWCENRWGYRHPIMSDATPRPFDLPWVVLDSSIAKNEWGWAPRTKVHQILEEIAVHAEKNQDWLELSAPL